MKYQDYVELGKSALSNIKTEQANIASYALKVCEIRHGGMSCGFYTIKDYARDIGMNRKTLAGWIHTYRDVCLKIDLKEPSAKEWSDARKVTDILKSERAQTNKSLGKTGTRTAYRQNIPKDKIKNLFNEINSGSNTEIIKLERMLQSSSFIKFTLQNMSFNNLDRSKLITIMENLDIASDVINEALSKRDVA